MSIHSTCEIIDLDLFRQRQHHAFHFFHMAWIGFVSVQGLDIFEAHQQADVEGIINHRSLTGTGSALAAAIDVNLANGKDLPDAVSTAKDYLNDCLRHSYRFIHPNGEVIDALNQGTRF